MKKPRKRKIEPLTLAKLFEMIRSQYSREDMMEDFLQLSPGQRLRMRDRVEAAMKMLLPRRELCRGLRRIGRRGRPGGHRGLDVGGVADVGGRVHDEKRSTPEA